MKLRIPQLLLSEKMRTQSRFNVSPRAGICVLSFAPLLKRGRPQTMRIMDQPAPGAPKHAQNASHKIRYVVQRILVPLLDAPLPSFVSFKQPHDAGGELPSGDHDGARELLDYLRKSEPDSMRSRESFVERMGRLYDAGASAGVPMPDASV